jgi:D-serine deaminase-like pyridoxal phosphate-dependent protein
VNSRRLPFSIHLRLRFTSTQLSFLSWNTWQVARIRIGDVYRIGILQPVHVLQDHLIIRLANALGMGFLCRN